MKSSVAITILLWFAAIALFIPSVTADKELVASNADRSLEARSVNDKVPNQPGHLRKQKESAEEDNGFTLWDFAAIVAMVPEYSQHKSSRAWPVLVATVSDSNGNPAYYTAPMPSGMKTDLNYFLKVGQMHGDLASLSTAISDHTGKMDEAFEPSIESRISGSQLLDLINIWGAYEISQGNSYRFAANDPVKCAREWHDELPANSNPFSLTPSNACSSLIWWAMLDGMRLEPCIPGDAKVALSVAFNSKNQFQDFNWYRRMHDGTWTHKPWRGEVRDSDASGKTIQDTYNPPSTCNRNYLNYVNFQYFCGNLCVPGGSIDLDKNDGQPCP
jgi:hypothetical protein